MEFSLNSNAISNLNLAISGTDQFFSIGARNITAENDILNTSSELYYANSSNAYLLELETTSASVPFNFSPTLGLLTMGGLFSISRIYKKSILRKTR